MVDKSVSYVQALTGTVTLLNAGAGASASGHCACAFVAEPESVTPEALEAADGAETYQDASVTLEKSQNGAANAHSRWNMALALALYRAEQPI